MKDELIQARVTKKDIAEAVEITKIQDVKISEIVREGFRKEVKRLKRRIRQDETAPQN